MYDNQPSEVEADRKSDWDAGLASFTASLNFLANQLSENSDPRALEISDEAVKYSKLVYDSVPDKGSETLAWTLCELATSIMKPISSSTSVPEGWTQRGQEWGRRLFVAWRDWKRCILT